MGSNQMQVGKVRHVYFASLVFLLGAQSFAQRPRNDGRSEMTVPKDHAKLGRVYYLVESNKPQVTFKSNTSVEKFKGTTTQLAGYVVASTDEGSLPVVFKAAEFRLPVVSFDTGNSSRTDHLGGERWLNKRAYPEIIFTIDEVRDAELVKERKDSTSYKATLVGTMVVVGQEKELAIKARIALKPENKKTLRIAPGDLMTITAKFDITLSDFGIGIDDQAIEAKRIAKKMRIDVRLTLSTKKPVMGS